MGLIGHVGLFDPPGHLVVKSSAKQEVTFYFGNFLGRAGKHWALGPIFSLPAFRPISYCNQFAASSVVCRLSLTFNISASTGQMFLKFCTRIQKTNTRKNLFLFFDFDFFSRFWPFGGHFYAENDRFSPILNLKLLLLRNRSPDFLQIWYRASLGQGLSSLFKV